MHHFIVQYPHNQKHIQMAFCIRPKRQLNIAALCQVTIEDQQSTFLSHAKPSHSLTQSTQTLTKNAKLGKKRAVTN